MKQCVMQCGNSIVIPIPNAFAEQLGFAKNMEVEVLLEKEQLVIKPVACTLEVLLAQITPDQLHEEQDFGTPVGKEVW